MKKFGKSLSFLLVMALLLSLAACVQNPDVTTASGGDNVTTGGNVPPTTGIDSPAATTKPIVLDIDMSLPWIKADVENANRGAFSNLGYYFLPNGKLSFLDTETGISVVLCQKASCKHNNEKCEAYIRGGDIIFFSKNHIYYNKMVQSDPYSVYIFRRNADGTGEEEIAVLGQEYISQTVNLGIGEYLATEEALYFIVYLREIQKQDDGSIQLQERDGILLRLDLETKKQEAILRKENTLIRLFGARDDALLFYTQERPPAETNLDSDYYDKIEELPAQLQVWSESTGGCVTLFEKPNKECTWILGLQGTKLYYTDEDDYQYFAYDLVTDTHTALDWTESYVLVNDNYLLDVNGDTPESEIIIHSKFIDLRTGQYVPSVFDDAYTKIKNITDRGCVIEVTYDGEPIPNGHDSYIIPRLRQIVAYVAFDALEDGLQESDLLVISDETYE